ncbi:MAG: 50S ribosomal protein L18 [Candidatus Paraimprobicoccus trichonymphae]|uniref:Large ribosomal subunit protein uL18 n=1 Tax=Candidatus Paraimprobicoccus trichonymphae TaxID=3033793 RepID=A0AA48HWQ9_9FIRM|nr:MAG: 50S ribosomal protein L18 [Candidatus Paraimprobicoccus trichonymphae]
MINEVNRNKARIKRHKRIRNKIFGNAERPRLNVFRSLKNIYAQIIDDDKKITLVSASSLDKKFKDICTGNKIAAREVGKLLAEKALKKKINVVIFDRGGYLYHGRVKELADGARETGLKF